MSDDSAPVYGVQLPAAFYELFEHCGPHRDEDARRSPVEREVVRAWMNGEVRPDRSGRSVVRLRAERQVLVYIREFARAFLVAYPTNRSSSEAERRSCAQSIQVIGGVLAGEPLHQCST